MKNIFVTSDQHFGHSKILTFTDSEGKIIRPFSSIEEMDETLIKNYNDKVKPIDKCYFLGDIVINKKSINILERLNGDKVLIRGNHDTFKDNLYRKYFRSLRAYHIMNKIILSHIPIHEQSLDRFRANVHGHLHENVVRLSNGTPDTRYINVCVEKTNYAPLEWSEILQRI